MGRAKDVFGGLANLALVIAALPIGALLESAMIRRIWTWLLAPQYGPGPSLAAWFGVSAIVTILTHHLMTSKSSKGREIDDDFGKLAKQILGGWAVKFGFLLLTMGTGFLLGWIQ